MNAFYCFVNERIPKYVKVNYDEFVKTYSLHFQSLLLEKLIIDFCHFSSKPLIICLQGISQ